MLYVPHNMPKHTQDKSDAFLPAFAEKRALSCTTLSPHKNVNVEQFCTTLSYVQCQGFSLCSLSTISELVKIGEGMVRVRQRKALG